jgi:hypothetical protein
VTVNPIDTEFLDESAPSDTFSREDLLAAYDAATTLPDEDLVKEAFNEWLEKYQQLKQQQ